MAHDLVCIICPRGCSLHVDDEMNVSGNTCIRGKNYALQELSNPTRTVTSTVYVSNSNSRVVPCKTSLAIPKGKIFEVMKEINKVSAKAPIHIGDVLIKDVLGLGVDIVATGEVLE